MLEFDVTLGLLRVYIIVCSLTVDPEPFTSLKSWWILKNCKLHVNSFLCQKFYWRRIRLLLNCLYISVYRHVDALKLLQQVSVSLLSFSPAYALKPLMGEDHRYNIRLQSCSWRIMFERKEGHGLLFWVRFRHNIYFNSISGCMIFDQMDECLCVPGLPGSSGGSGRSWGGACFGRWKALGDPQWAAWCLHPALQNPHRAGESNPTVVRHAHL